MKDIENHSTDSIKNMDQTGILMRLAKTLEKTLSKQMKSKSKNMITVPMSVEKYFIIYVNSIIILRKF